jgi:hypothetical protein
LEFDLLILQKQSTEDGDLIRDEYIWKKLTFVTSLKNEKYTLKMRL